MAERDEDVAIIRAARGNWNVRDDANDLNRGGEVLDIKKAEPLPQSVTSRPELRRNSLADDRDGSGRRDAGLTIECGMLTVDCRSRLFNNRHSTFKTRIYDA